MEILVHSTLACCFLCCFNLSYSALLSMIIFCKRVNEFVNFSIRFSWTRAFSTTSSMWSKDFCCSGGSVSTSFLIISTICQFSLRETFKYKLLMVIRIWPCSQICDIFWDEFSSFVVIMTSFSPSSCSSCFYLNAIMAPF